MIASAPSPATVSLTITTISKVLCCKSQFFEWLTDMRLATYHEPKSPGVVGQRMMSLEEAAYLHAFFKIKILTGHSTQETVSLLENGDHDDPVALAFAEVMVDNYRSSLMGYD